MPEPQGSDRPNFVAAAIERAKRHAIVVVVGTLVGLLVFLTTVGDLYGRISGAMHDWRNPHDEDYKQLAELDLGVTPDYLEGWLGTARRSVDVGRFDTGNFESLCVGHPAQGAEVVAQPGHRWLQLVGEQGDRVPLQARVDEYRTNRDEVRLVHVHGEGLVLRLGPTRHFAAHVDMLLGPQSSAYVEIIAGGAPADYRGLILASAPTGWSGPGSFDRESAEVVMQLSETSYDAEVSAPFRSESRPNTFGEFIDDGGVVSVLARDAEFDRVLLYQFTSL